MATHSPSPTHQPALNLSTTPQNQHQMPTSTENMSRFISFSTSLPSRPIVHQRGQGASDSHNAFLNLTSRKTTSPLPTLTRRASLDTPLKPHHPSHPSLRQSFPSLKGPYYRLGSLELSIFEDSILTPPVAALHQGKVENAKLAMLIHLNHSEYNYINQVITWAWPLANTLDLITSSSSSDLVAPLLAGHIPNCEFFREVFLTKPVDRLNSARERRNREEVEGIQKEIRQTVMGTDKHIEMSLQLLTMLAERIEVAKQNGIRVDFPETAKVVPECAEAIAGYVSAKGWGICFGEKTEEYWTLRERLWGMITRIHLGYDLIKHNEVEKGNFSPWIEFMIGAVEDEVDIQDIHAWKKQEQDDLYDYFTSDLEH